MLSEYLTREEDALEIDVDDSLPLVFGDAEERSRGIYSGRIHQDVDSAQFGDRFAEDILEIFFARGIGSESDRSLADASDFGGAALRLFKALPDDRDVRSGSGECLRHFSCQHTTTANYDGDFAS